MFATIRGVDAFGVNFQLPTTDNFFNIFHPYDPVAYRIEALVNPDLATLRPVLVPHHKGRKRMHLELRETMARVGADLKQRIFSTFRTTLNTVYNFTTIQKTAKDTEAIEHEVEKVRQGAQRNVCKLTQSIYVYFRQSKWHTMVQLKRMRVLPMQMSVYPVHQVR